MYEYLNMINLSLMLSIIYILYSKWRSVSITNNRRLLFVAIIISVYSLLMMYDKAFYNAEIIRYNHMMINIIFILRISAEINLKENRMLSLCNLLSIILVFTSMVESISKFNDIIIFYVYISSLFVCLLSSRKNKINRFDKVMCISSYIYVGIYLIYGIESLRYNIVGEILSLIIYTNIFYRINKKYVKNINKKIEIQSKKILTEGKEIIKLKNDLKINCEIRDKIKNNIDKKNNILNNMLNEKQKCVFIMDEYGYISDKDKNFYNMWYEYKNKNRNISMYSFVEKNIKDKEEFLKCINEVKEYNETIIKEFEGEDNRYFKFKFVKISLNEDFLGVLCDVDDISYRRNTQLKINENDIKYKTIVDNIPYNILVIKDRKITYKNSEELDINNGSLKEIVGMKNVNKEIKVLTKNNEKQYKNISSASFENYDGEESVIAIKDITEYKNILKKLEVSQEKYKSLVDIIPEGIYTFELDSNEIKYINKNMYNTIKGEEQLLNIKTKISENLIVNKQDIGECIEFTRLKSIGINNQTIDIESGRMLIKIGDKIKVIGIVRDITEQVKLEEVKLDIERKKARQKVKADFFINLSHELRTPLNVIESTGQLINKLLNETAKINNKNKLINEVKNIREYTSIMRGIVNQTIELDEIECGIEQCDAENYNLVTIVEYVIDEVLDNNIEIIFDTEREELICKINEEHVYILIKNILSMILRYSNSDSKVEIYMSKFKDDNIRINIVNTNGYNSAKYNNEAYKSINKRVLSAIEKILNIYKGEINVINIDNSIEINLYLALEDEYLHNGYSSIYR